MKRIRRNHTARSDTAQLQKELHDTAQALRYAYDRFNYACDPELVDSCVFEINALQAKYNYLLRLAKAPEDECVAALADGGGAICLS